MPYTSILAALFLSTGVAAGDDSYEMETSAQASPVLVEHLSTAQPSGFVPVTGASGVVDLRRATVVDTIAPSDPQINDLWIDASAGGKYRTCIYTGSSWIETDGSGESCGTIYQRTLVVGAYGSGSGVVFSLPGGIACGEDCAKPFTLGEAVQLYAVPAEDSLFLGWSGCSTETASSISVLMDQDRVCGAEFATSIGIATADWSPGYTLYYDFEEVFAAGGATAEKLVPNWGTAGAACDLRQYGSSLPIGLSEVAQQGASSISLKSLGSGVNQRLGVRTQSDAVNGSCDAARLGGAGAGYGSFSYHSRFRPQLNTESGATLSKISEIANGGPGGWAFEWQENGVVVGRAFNGSAQSALVSANGACPAGEWCVVSLVFDDPLDTFCLYVNGQVAACTGMPTITDPATGTLAYFRFGSSSNSSKLDGLVDESGLRLGSAYTAEEACRVCSCGIDGSLCSCDPLTPQLFSAGGGNGLNGSQCGGCALPACDQEAPP
jgi:hypothetical protein